MKRIGVIGQQVHLCIILGIILISAAFFITSCGTNPLEGTGPQEKIADIDAGQYALDFTSCPSGPCRAIVKSEVFIKDPDKTIANKELTAEAWVKKDPKTPAGSFTGGILGRFDIAGLVLFLNGGEPKAAIRRVGATGTSTATSDYIVSSGMQIADNLWHHIAAVLTSENHSGVHADCGATDTTTVVG